MANRKYIDSLNVGVARTLSGGVAIGGNGKHSERVISIAKAQGLKLHPNTGEWFTTDGSKFDAVLQALENAR